jgi:hypothetical protein
MTCDELTREQLAWCKQEAEQALERAAEKIFGPLEESPPEKKDAIRSGPRIAPEVTKTAANTISARSVAENGAAARKDCAMPSFDEPETVCRTALCARCETLGSGHWNPQEGTFEWRCECCVITLTGITKLVGPDEIRCCTLPYRMVGLRPSSRLLSVGIHGRLWREVWPCPEGVIVQSGGDFVSVWNANDRAQFWAHSFAEAYGQLIGKPWLGVCAL